MRQILFHIPHELGGLPVFGPGWLLIAWGVLSTALLIWLVRRQGWTADTRGCLPVLFVIGAAIAFLAPLLEKKDFDGQPIGLAIPSFGVMLLLAILSGVALGAKRARSCGLDPDLVYSLSFWMVLAGIVGARVFYVAEYWAQFQRAAAWETALEAINFTKGGIVMYGGLIGSLAAALACARLYKAPTWLLADVLAPAMLLGLAIGRIGCLLNGCCFGGVCELPAAPRVQFPTGSPAYIHQQRLGLLHGIRIGTDDAGRPVLERLHKPDRPGSSTALRAGDVVKSIQLSMWTALDAAQQVPEFAGAALEIETTDGRKIQSPIERSLSLPSYLGQNEIGFRVRSGDARLPVVAEVVGGGPAARAGLRVGDVLQSIRLPPLPNAEAAHGVLPWAGDELTVETEDGRSGVFRSDQHRNGSLPVHPTQIYSSINAGLLCLLLWAWFPFRRRDGEVAALMLTLYPITRILLEVIRDDEGGVAGTPLTISQVVSLAILPAAAALWLWLLRSPPRTAPGGLRPG